MQERNGALHVYTARWQLRHWMSLTDCHHVYSSEVLPNVARSVATCHGSARCTTTGVTPPTYAVLQAPPPPLHRKHFHHLLLSVTSFMDCMFLGGHWACFTSRYGMDIHSSMARVFLSPFVEKFRECSEVLAMQVLLVRSICATHLHIYVHWVNICVPWIKEGTLRHASVSSPRHVVTFLQHDNNGVNMSVMLIWVTCDHE